MRTLVAAAIVALLAAPAAALTAAPEFSPLAPAAGERPSLGLFDRREDWSELLRFGRNPQDPDMWRFPIVLQADPPRLIEQEGQELLWCRDVGGAGLIVVPDGGLCPGPEAKLPDGRPVVDKPKKHPRDPVIVPDPTGEPVIVPEPTEPTAVIPLPAAAWLLLSALAGLGIVARRKRYA